MSVFEFLAQKSAEPLKLDTSANKNPKAPPEAKAPYSQVSPSDGPTTAPVALETVGPLAFPLAQRKAPPVPRDELGRILPGYSGNPRGRMPGLIPYIKAHSADGREMLDHAFLAMRGELRVPDIHFTQMGEAIHFERAPTIKEEADARNYLLERYYGKAPTQVDINVIRADNVAVTLEGLSDEETFQYLAIERKLSAAGAAIVDAEIIPDDGETETE